MNGWTGYHLEDIGDDEKRAQICGVDVNSIRKGVQAIVLDKPLDDARADAQGVLDKGPWPRFYFTKNGAGGIRRKTYLEGLDGRMPTNLWPYNEVGHTDEAKKEVKKLFDGSVPFDTPKPVRLMQRIIDIATSENSIVLDFFSGSGSMAEAVMTKNGEDAGARRFVLVQIPEEATGDYATLCDMGEERIRRAGKKIAEEVEEGNQHLKIGEEPRPVPDVGFRVFRIDSSNFRETYREPGEVDQSSIFEFVDNLKDDRTAEDLLFQVLPKFRIPYSAKVEERQVCGKRVFDVNGGQLVACFDDEVGADAIEAIAKERPLYAVFRDSSLADDATEANFEELFKTYSPDTIRRVI
jgi:adenine-specific DNA-methyltransferase